MPYIAIACLWKVQSGTGQRPYKQAIAPTGGRRRPVSVIRSGGRPGLPGAKGPPSTIGEPPHGMGGTTGEVAAGPCAGNADALRYLPGVPVVRIDLKPRQAGGVEVLIGDLRLQAREGEPQGAEKNERIVQLPQDRNQSGYEIDRHRAIAKPADERRLLDGGDASISDEASHQANVARKPSDDSHEDIAARLVGYRCGPFHRRSLLRDVGYRSSSADDASLPVVVLSRDATARRSRPVSRPATRAPSVASRSASLPAVSLDCRVRRDIAKDSPLTYADVELPPNRLVDRLRSEMIEHFARPAVGGR